MGRYLLLFSLTDSFIHSPWSKKYAQIVKRLFMMQKVFLQVIFRKKFFVLFYFEVILLYFFPLILLNHKDLQRFLSSQTISNMRLCMVKSISNDQNDNSVVIWYKSWWFIAVLSQFLYLFHRSKKSFFWNFLSWWTEIPNISDCVFNISFNCFVSCYNFSNFLYLSSSSLP